MPRRITRALFTAAAAGATITSLGVAAASPANAAGHGSKVFAPSGGTPIATNASCPLATLPPVRPQAGHTVIDGSIPVPPPSDNCARAGYQASGRNFRFAQAQITVPNHLGSTETADPTMYVALDNSSSNTYQYTRVGIAPCPADEDAFIVPGYRVTCPTTLEGNTSDWVIFSATADAGSPPELDVEGLPAAMMGDGILVNVYLVPTSNAVHTVVDLPDGTTFNNTYPITGPVYTKAQAVADWTPEVENGADKPQPPVASSKGRDVQFFQGRFTTVSGVKGTFAGPWALNALEVTSNGTLPPVGTLMEQPSYLWNDGKGVNGLGSDAFGVWHFPF